MPTFHSPSPATLYGNWWQGAAKVKKYINLLLLDTIQSKLFLSFLCRLKVFSTGLIKMSPSKQSLIPYGCKSM